MLVKGSGDDRTRWRDLSRSGALAGDRLDERVLPIAVLDHKQTFVLGLGAAGQRFQSDRVGVPVGAVDQVRGAARQIVPWGVPRAIADLTGAKLFAIIRRRHAGRVEEILVLANPARTSLGALAFRRDALDLHLCLANRYRPNHEDPHREPFPQIHALIPPTVTC